MARNANIRTGPTSTSVTVTLESVCFEVSVDPNQPSPYIYFALFNDER
jgi:hypothetical protein